MSNSIYLERAEKKFEVGLSRNDLPSLWDDIGRYLPLREFIPGQPITHNNTIYFDSEDCFLLRNGLQNRYDHFRIRIRKYEYNAPTSINAPGYWMELKLRKGEFRKKRRIKLEGEDLKDLLKGKKMQERVLGYNDFGLHSEEGREVYKEIQEIILERDLKPLLLTSYKRMAFENESQRLSIDWDIRYFHVGSTIFNTVSLKDIPQEPAAHDQVVILEFKYKGEFPSWISELQRRYPIWYRRSLSKLDRGMKALLDGPLHARGDSNSLLEMMYTHKEKGWDLCGQP